jgi:isopenicillin-N N-acyltransferase-like protein
MSRLNSHLINAKGGSQMHKNVLNYFRNIISVVIFSLAMTFAMLSLTSCDGDEESVKTDEMPEHENGIYHIQLKGNPTQMGLARGRYFKAQIKDAVNAYKENVYKVFGVENGEKIIEWALTTADFQKDIKENAPHIFEEIEGIAEGSEVPVADILLLNMFEEIYETAPLQLGIDTQEYFGFGCTAFGVYREDEEKFNGQNIDFSTNYDSKPVMIRYNYPDKEILMYTFVGRIGGVGLNEKGLSVFTTTLPQGIKSENGGLGSSYILRLLLEQNSVDQAVEMLKKSPRFGSFSYSLADHEKSLMVEASADEVIVKPMERYPGFQCHTNHMLWIEPENRIDLPGIFENGQPLPGAASFYTQERLEQANDPA